MKRSIGGFDIVISEWTPRLKISTVVFAVITLISSAITLFGNYKIPGLTPIALGITMLLLGVREWNRYFKTKKSIGVLLIAIIDTLLFVVLLIIGIDQIMTVVMKQAGF